MTYTRITQADTRRFWSYVDRSGECWRWTGCHKSDGRGQFGVGKDCLMASRVAYILTYGDPGAAYVLHQCKTRDCVRPDHLCLSTMRQGCSVLGCIGRHYALDLCEAHWCKQRRLRKAQATR